MDKVQQIKAEIEKILNEGLMKLKEQGLPPKGEQMTLKKLLSFIDSLPDVSETDFGKKEEPVNEDLKKFAEEWDESLYRSDAVIAGAKMAQTTDDEGGCGSKNIFWKDRPLY